MIKRRSFGDNVLDIFIYMTLGITAIITLLPLLNVFSKAFSADWAVMSGSVSIFPIDFQFDAMSYVLKSKEFLNSLKISVFVTLVGTALSILMTAITAYPLSKKNLYGVKAMLLLYVFTMMFGGGLIPTYLVMKMIGLVNKLSVLIIPAMINVFNMLVIKNYYESLPESLEESAKLDGASNAYILFKIILPLSKPVLATISLFYAVGFWNDYFTPMIYISKPELRPLQVYLRDAISQLSENEINRQQTFDEAQHIAPESVRAATIVASTVPILLSYPYLQKYFIKGVLIGSVKG